MKLNVVDNYLNCPEIHCSINHMECSDECKFFNGCTIENGKFVIDCLFCCENYSESELIEAKG